MLILLTVIIGVLYRRFLYPPEERRLEDYRGVIFISVICGLILTLIT